MKWPALILLHSSLIFLFGCTSAKPPAQVSPLRQEAARAETSARAAYDRQAWTSAAQLFGKTAEAYAAIEDEPAQADALHNQAQSLQRAQHIESAVETYERAAAINARLNRTAERARNLTGLAQCAAARSNYDLAVETAEQALKLVEKDAPTRALVENDLAMHLLERGRPADRDRIVGFLTSAAKWNQQFHNAAGLAINDLNFGRAHLKFGQLELAEARLARALVEFRALDDVRGLAQAHEILAQVYVTRKDDDRAKFHRQQALDKYAFLKDEAAMKRLDQAK